MDECFMGVGGVAWVCEGLFGGEGPRGDWMGRGGEGREGEGGSTKSHVYGSDKWHGFR